MHLLASRRGSQALCKRCQRLCHSYRDLRLVALQTFAIGSSFARAIKGNKLCRPGAEDHAPQPSGCG